MIVRIEDVVILIDLPTLFISGIGCPNFDVFDPEFVRFHALSFDLQSVISLIVINELHYYRVSLNPSLSPKFGRNNPPGS